MEPKIGMNSLYMLTLPGELYLSTMYHNVKAAADMKAAYSNKDTLAGLKFMLPPLNPIFPTNSNSKEPVNICPPELKKGLMSLGILLT